MAAAAGHVLLALNLVSNRSLFVTTFSPCAVCEYELSSRSFRRSRRVLAAFAAVCCRRRLRLWKDVTLWLTRWLRTCFAARPPSAAHWPQLMQPQKRHLCFRRI